MAVGYRVLIVGGGISGLCAALALRRAGVNVDVVEADRKWSVDDVGMIVHENFPQALAAIGIAVDAIAVSFPSEGAAFEDCSGNPISRTDALSLEAGACPPALGLSRLALHKLLAGAVLASGANVRLGVTFEEIRQSDADRRATVTFTDGTIANYDLVVGADGSGSRVRAAVFGSEVVPQLTGQVRWRCRIRRRPDIDRPFLRLSEDGSRCGYLPISARAGCIMMLDNQPLEENCPPERLPQIFRSRLATFTGKLAELREEIGDPAAIVCRPVEFLFMPDPWYRGRVLLIGDASHTMTALMAQGAVQAAEDGVALGDLFAQRLPLPELLRAFMAARFARCKLIAQIAPLIERRVHLSGPAQSFGRVAEIRAMAAETPV